MNLEEQSRKAYLLENWIDAKSVDAWEKLSDAGWIFNRPQYNPFTVGITMTRGTDSATFRVDSRLHYEAINARLLYFCKTFAFAVENRQ